MELCSLLAGAGLWDNVLLTRDWTHDPSVSQVPQSGFSVLFLLEPAFLDPSQGHKTKHHLCARG